jgi:hypothetical protein
MLKHLFAAVAACLAVVSVAEAAPRGDCRAQAVRDLERWSPDGYAVYAAMRDKADFLRWITCDDVQLSLTTAVHESVHLLTHEKDGYPLIEGGVLRRPKDLVRYYAPRGIAGRFDAGDMFVKTYLGRGAASSADDFTYLLDELNAYSHDLHSAVKLAPLHKGGGQAAHRDGLSALMAFVMRYVGTAQAQHPATWQGLQQPETKQVVQKLWSQAETVLASSCGFPAYGTKDKTYVGFLCNAGNAAPLAGLLGRAPVCARACLPAGTAAVQ